MNDKKYNSYQQEYSSEYIDKNRYEPTVKDYGNENNYQKTYGKDNNNNYYKSKKDSSSVSINKINCINPNVNFNGDNNGNIITFAASPGRTTANAGTDEGELSAGSFSGGNDGGRYYDDGYNKKDKDFACIINNNNNNTINVAAGAGNATDQCATDIEACFAQFLNATEFQQLTNALNNGITVKIGENTVTLNSFADMCDALEGLTFEFDSLIGAISDIAFQAGILSLGGGIFECIAEALGIPITPTLAPASVTSELDVPTILQLR